MKCNEVLPRDGINLGLDGTPTTEKEASLSVAMLRGASDWPWCVKPWREDFGMRVTLRGARDRPWCVKSWCKDLRWDYLSAAREGDLVMDPVKTPCDRPS